MTTVIATKEGIYTDTKCSYKINFKVHKFAKIGTRSRTVGRKRVLNGVGLSSSMKYRMATTT